MADIPGIIEGASEGKGLGLRFLRHIERNSILLFMVAADSKDITEEYNILLNELETYNPELTDKQRILAITKSDMLDEELTQAIQDELKLEVETIFISSVTGQGIQELKDLIWNEINKESNKIVEISHRPMYITTVEPIEEELIEDEFYDDDDEDDDISKYKGIGWDEL